MQEGQCPQHRKAWNAAVQASLQDSDVWKALRLLFDKGTSHSLTHHFLDLIAKMTAFSAVHVPHSQYVARVLLHKWPLSLGGSLCCAVKLYCAGLVRHGALQIMQPSIIFACFQCLCARA